MQDTALYLNTPAGALIKTTLVDFPQHTAASVFFEGCNLHCPYCYNASLVLGEKSPDCINGIRNYPCSSLKEIFNHLEKRKNLLTGLVISGGEPLLNPRTPLLIKEAKKLGYKIKLDTNGTLPEKLESYLADPELKPDYIAMDFKTTQKKTGLLLPQSKKEMAEEIYKKIIKSINILAKLPGTQREFRTVLVPSLTDKEDVKEMASLLPSDALWYFTQFRNENCLDPSYSKITPYLEKDLKEIVDNAKEIIKGAVLR